jgi:hypothetical protein
MSRLGRVATLLIVVALVTPAVPAGAHDHKRPRVTLRSHGESQRGGPWSSNGPEPTGNFACPGLGTGFRTTVARR